MNPWYPLFYYKGSNLATLKHLPKPYLTPQQVAAIGQYAKVTQPLPFVPQTPSIWQQGLFGNNPQIGQFVADLGTGLLDAGGSSFGTPLTVLGNAVQLTEFLPSIYNPDGLAAITSSFNTATSITGGLFGAYQGLQWGAVAGFAVGNVPGAFVGSVVGSALGGWGGSVAFEQIGKFMTNTITKNATAINNFLNAFQNQVGGVLFDQAAEVMTDLEEITGAYWDEVLGQLVLVGKKNGKTEELFLPKMDKDHLAVAVRAVFANENIGVSIDQPVGYENSFGFPPSNTMMPVRYLGNTQDTLFGAIMFEADKLLKNLSSGKDNVTGKEVTSLVTDFQNELDLSMKCKSGGNHAWTRMWFVIEDMKLSLEVKESSDRNSLVFGKASLKVKAEYLNKEKTTGVNAAAEQFAKHFTLHFDEIAKEYPILERLKELAKIVAIAKYLKDSGKPVDLSFLDDYEFIKVNTPKETPGIITSKSWQTGTNSYQTYSLFGGVDFDFEYKPSKDNGEAERLRKIVQENRPCETVLGWEFGSNGGTKKALAVPLAARNGNYTTSHIDISSPIANETKLDLVRYYDSFNTKPTIFGYGWDLVAYKLLILRPAKEAKIDIYPPIFLVDKINHKSYKYAFVKGKKAYFLVKEEKIEARETLFTYDPQNFITQDPEGDFTWKSEKSLSYNFNSQGRLISVAGNNKAKISYIYQGNLLVKLADNSGKYISLNYDQQKRIRQAVVSSGQKILDYSYDIYGDLTKVLDNGKEVISYIYDADHRLIKIKDNQGRVVQRNNYDQLGRVVKKRTDIIADNGNLITKSYDDNYRLIKEEDKEGNNIFYEYDNNSNLTKSVISDKWERKTILEHDQEERIRKITNPLGHGVRFSYDVAGNITSLTDAKNHTKTFAYDNNGNLILFRGALGNEWKQEFDEFSRLKSITNPLGQSAKLNYRNDKLVCIETPEGAVSYRYDKKGNLIKISAADGSTMKFIYDSKNNLTRLEDVCGKVTKYNYDPSGRLSSIINPRGEVVAINNS